MGPLLKAFPKLELLRIRGSAALQFKNAKHETLRALAIESGACPKQLSRRLPKPSSPTSSISNCGWAMPVMVLTPRSTDLLPILKGTAFPKLKHLGLRNADIMDDIAV